MVTSQSLQSLRGLSEQFDLVALVMSLLFGFHRIVPECSVWT